MFGALSLIHGTVNNRFLPLGKRTSFSWLFHPFSNDPVEENVGEDAKLREEEAAARDEALESRVDDRWRVEEEVAAWDEGWESRVEERFRPLEPAAWVETW